MSLVSKHQHFLHLVSSAHPKQAFQLLKTSSLEQVNSIGELFENILQSYITLSPEKLKLFRTHRQLVRQIASRDLKSARRLRLVYKHYRIVRKLLQSFSYDTEDGPYPV